MKKSFGRVLVLSALSLVSLNPSAFANWPHDSVTKNQSRPYPDVKPLDHFGRDGLHYNPDFNLPIEITGNEITLNDSDNCTKYPEACNIPNFENNDRNDFQSPQFENNVLVALSKGQSPIYACNDRLSKNDPDRYQELSKKVGFYLPTLHPVEEFKSELEREKDNSNESNKKSKKQSKSAVLVDVSFCQNEHKLECMTLLRKSISNPSQANYQTQCNNQVVDDFKKFIGNVKGIEQVSCQNAQIMTMQIIYALDGAPDAFLKNVSESTLKSMLEKINPSAHNAIKCLTNNGKIKLGRGVIDLNQKTYKGRLTGLNYDSGIDLIEKNDENEDVLKFKVDIGLGAFAESFEKIFSKAFDTLLKNKELEVRIKEINTQNEQFLMNHKLQENHLENQKRETSIREINANTAKTEAQIKKDAAEFKKNMTLWEKGFAVDFEGKGKISIKDGYDGNGHLLPKDKTILTDPSLGKRPEIFVDALKNYSFAQGTEEAVCEVIYNGYDQGVDPEKDIHYTQDYWNKIEQNKKPTEWDKGEKVTITPFEENKGVSTNTFDRCSKVTTVDPDKIGNF